MVGWWRRSKNFTSSLKRKPVKLHFCLQRALAQRRILLGCALRPLCLARGQFEFRPSAHECAEELVRPISLLPPGAAKQPRSFGPAPCQRQGHWWERGVCVSHSSRPC
ncbi:hypothetical protein AK812_SmicGene19527 [Symbiodinium microadriaticum]|uniref:Uncharacterized protein n=1 Tax=Symbiodinium microadriaticum TaxID=2951 RepID=A0A1Q9DSC4_SYMMI|nr:hypothetical protein AK812_SmicGene19527 [Symbiodinium microadriaticum]